MADYGSFEYASYQDLETIQKFLESLTQGFAKEQIVLSSGDDTIELRPKNLLKFSVSAKKKEDKTKLSIKISWKEGKIKAAKTPLEIGPD
ncbi:MAG: amphi-Trp domain-containing protein [Desulfobacterales bacterium]|nr:amphi-Trp domain-containing protein [Desulfobacterales bacterium]